METPCVGICAVEPATGQCRGCRRTTAEIAAWVRMSPGERRAIMYELRSRSPSADNALPGDQTR